MKNELEQIEAAVKPHCREGESVLDAIARLLRLDNGCYYLAFKDYSDVWRVVQSSGSEPGTSTPRQFQSEGQVEQAAASHARAYGLDAVKIMKLVATEAEVTVKIS